MRTRQTIKGQDGRSKTGINCALSYDSICSERAMIDRLTLGMLAQTTKFHSTPRPRRG